MQVSAIFSDNYHLLLLVLEWGGGTLTKRHLCPAFRQGGKGQRIPPVSAISLLPSAQNNPYAKAAYFQVAYSDPFMPVLSFIVVCLL